VDGLLVPPGDAPALAEAAAGLLRDPERCHALGAAARAKVEERFAAGTVARQTAEWYRRVMG
jgi:D-inositol-3-phosphate glycosyltransferase